MRSLPHDPRKLLATYLGGVVGALLRVGLAEVGAVGSGQWPWPTFVVNMVGALLLGWFYTLYRDQPEESLRHPFLGTGICGTLTTFSTMQLELFRFVDDGHLALAVAYAGATIALGYLCVRLGIALERGRGELVAVSATKSSEGDG